MKFYPLWALGKLSIFCFSLGYFSDMQEGHLTLFLRAVDLLDGQKSCESITIILYDASGVALAILSVKWNLSDYED